MPSPRILIADDSDLYRNILTTFANELDYTITGEATDGKTAVALAQQLHPDIAILDAMMPVMDGYQACDIIQGTLNIPVILITAHTNGDNISTIIKTSPAGIIIKPVNKIQLQVTINRVLTQVQSQKLILRYKNIVDHAPTMVAVISSDYKYVLANTFYCTAFGVNEEDIIGKNFSDVLADNVPEQFKPGIDQAFSGAITAHEGWFTFAFFGQRYMATHFSPYYEEGKIEGVAITSNDITELKRTQDLLVEANYKYHDLTSRIPGGVYAMRIHENGERSFEFVSKSMCKILDIRMEDALRASKFVHDTIHPEDRPDLDRADKLAAQTLQPFHWEGRYITRGETRWMRIQSNPLKLSDNESLWNGIIIDITNKVVQETELKKLACTDDLTGLLNRRQFIEMGELFLKSPRVCGSSFVVAMIDIDYFKTVNDEYGHLAGDAVLKEFSKIAAAHFRATDIVGRIGGDEFGVVLTQADESEALNIMQRFRASVSRNVIVYEDKSITITTSCGICTASFSEYSFKELLCKADQALYKAKQLGRNQVVAFP